MKNIAEIFEGMFDDDFDALTLTIPNKEDFKSETAANAVQTMVGGRNAVNCLRAYPEFMKIRATLDDTMNDILNIDNDDRELRDIVNSVTQLDSRIARYIRDYAEYVKNLNLCKGAIDFIFGVDNLLSAKLGKDYKKENIYWVGSNDGKSASVAIISFFDEKTSKEVLKVVESYKKVRTKAIEMTKNVHGKFIIEVDF